VNPDVPIHPAPERFRIWSACNTSAHLIIDMDGVLWRGKRPMEGLTDFFDFLRRHEIRFILATNNASRSRDDYVAQLARFGVAVRPEEVLPSCDATALYLRRIASPGARVLVIGEQALRAALAEAGFQVVDEEHADFVVVGFDWGLTYEKLARAARAIWNGARFIGTNPDPVWPGEDELYPGNGATLAFLERATGVAPWWWGSRSPDVPDRHGANGSRPGDHRGDRRPAAHRHPGREARRPPHHPGALRSDHSGEAGRKLDPA
jgi:HAD superfamily hydrolase (TIGR01450 family)